MRRRLLASTALIALAAVLVLGVPLGIVEAHRVRQDAARQLVREADDVAVAIDDRLERGETLDARVLARLVRPRHEVTVAVPGRRGLRVGTALTGAVLAERSPLAQSAVVTARASTHEVDERVAGEWALIAGLALAGVLAAVAFGVAQGRRLAAPLERLARIAGRLGTGDFSARAGRFAIPEVDVAAVALDASAVSIARLVAREREFSANASHQLRTPLTALRLRLEELQQLEARPAVRDEVDRALAEADRLEATIADLLAAAREAEGAGSGRLVDVRELLSAHAETWRPVISGAGRELLLELPAAFAAAVPAGAVGQAVDVLLDNALHHGDGRVRLSLERRSARLAISVSDQGVGPPAGLEEAIFDRGHSSEGSTGLGLHLAKSLARAAGGDLFAEVRSPPTFTILLPAIEPNAIATEATAGTTSAPPASRP